MTAEDVSLPSKQIEWELGSHAMKYCEQQLWCYNCGKPAHGANCDLYCSDCLDHLKNFITSYSKLNQLPKLGIKNDHRILEKRLPAIRAFTYR